MQSFSRSKSIAEISKVDLNLRLMVESSIEVLKVKAVFVSVSFIFYANLDLFAFIMSFLLLRLYFTSFELINTLVKLYLAPYRLILLIKTATLFTLVLLA